MQWFLLLCTFPQPELQTDPRVRLTWSHCFATRIPTPNVTCNLTWEPFQDHNLSYAIFDYHKHIWFNYRQSKYGFWDYYFPSIAKQDYREYPCLEKPPSQYPHFEPPVPWSVTFIPRFHFVFAVLNLDSSFWIWIHCFEFGFVIWNLDSLFWIWIRPSALASPFNFWICSS